MLHRYWILLSYVNLHLLDNSISNSVFDRDPLYTIINIKIKRTKCVIKPSNELGKAKNAK